MTLREVESLIIEVVGVQRVERLVDLSLRGRRSSSISWSRIKNITPSNPQSLGALSTALMAAMGLINRLSLSGLIDPIAGTCFMGSLIDLGFGRDGTSRCRYGLDCLLVELFAAVTDGRIPDCSLRSPTNQRSPMLESILTRFSGFAPPPPPVFATSAKGKGKGKGSVVKLYSTSSPTTESATKSDIKQQ
mmetsp:Transcript_24675/g.24415  ORF Transcript_24675/g.24415 Transcript_24675/m.24415 type:complete len:190 (-) Transcript_24675:116-685(-)